MRSVDGSTKAGLVMAHVVAKSWAGRRHHETVAQGGAHDGKIGRIPSSPPFINDSRTIDGAKVPGNTFLDPNT